MNQGLLLIDIQNDYFTGGAMELMGMEAAADRAARVLTAFREAGLPVLHIQHIAARPGAGFFLPGTRGAEIDERVQPREDELVIRKHFPNSFRETELLRTLVDLKVKRLVICGAMSHMCIDATTRAAFDLGFDCCVLEDACATRDLEFNGGTIAAEEVHGAFMAALASVYAAITGVDDFLRADLGRGQGER